MPLLLLLLPLLLLLKPGNRIIMNISECSSIMHEGKKNCTKAGGKLANFLVYNYFVASNHESISF